MCEGIEIALAGERFIALPSKTLWWPSESTLFLADLHLGKDASFRALSIPIPHGSTAATLDRLSAVIAATDARNVVALGDLWHDKPGRLDGAEDLFEAWRTCCSHVNFKLVVGNHDRRAAAALAGPGAGVEALAMGPFLCRHHPEPASGFHVLAGHIHPAVSLNARGGQRAIVPCFSFGPEITILPAFGEFTGVAKIRPSEEDTVVIVAAEQVEIVKQGRVFAIPISPFAQARDRDSSASAP